MQRLLHARCRLPRTPTPMASHPWLPPNYFPAKMGQPTASTRGAQWPPPRATTSFEDVILWDLAGPDLSISGPRWLK